jgi:uroporphyrinogen-III synthase
LLLLSSAESWHNLAAALPPDALRRLCATTAVVSSERLAGIAAAAGFARIRQAASAMADDLLAAAIGS